MMKLFCLAIILLCGVIAGCNGPDEPSDDSQLSQAPTIKPGTFSVTVNVDRPVFDRSITATTSCMPLVTGKGVIGLTGTRTVDMFDWILLSPITDTVSTVSLPYYTIHIPAEFKANETFTQRWDVRLLPRTGPAGSYYFGAHVYIDSIFIADSNRMYWIDSDVARKHCPRRLGWQPHAINEKNIYL
jgi:hypothetical protein